MAFLPCCIIVSIISIFVFLNEIYGWHTACCSIEIYCANCIYDFIKCSHNTLMSIAISSVSVMVAVYSIVLGNYKISGISLHTILKNAYKSQFLSSRVVLFICPSILIILSLNKLWFTFFYIFCLLVMSMFYMLHLCFSIFIDNGVKFVVIPKYITSELYKENHLKFNKKPIYIEFVQNISNDIISQSILQEALCGIVKTAKEDSIVNLENYYKTYTKVFNITYMIFNDIKIYLLRNTCGSKEYLISYFNYCTLSITKIFFSEKTKGKNNIGREDLFLLKLTIVIAILRNLLELTPRTDEDIVLLRDEMKKIYLSLSGKLGRYSCVFFNLVNLMLSEVLICYSENDFINVHSQNIHLIYSHLLQNIFAYTKNKDSYDCFSIETTLETVKILFLLFMSSPINSKIGFNIKPIYEISSVEKCINNVLSDISYRIEIIKNNCYTGLCIENQFDKKLIDLFVNYLPSEENYIHFSSYVTWVYEVND